MSLGVPTIPEVLSAFDVYMSAYRKKYLRTGNRGFRRNAPMLEEMRALFEVVDNFRRIAVAPAPDQIQKALRRLAIVQRHRLAYGGTTVHVGWTCKSCDSDWDRDEPEKHKPDCAAAFSHTGVRAA